ncbi:putative quinol monooxygenase [Paenarthrobacter sp. S56]|uniref:putative quinol monooxygenase n=1 Tax=Paenarthrobacter sp. S56 TaxID=3138179 RepID=UPI003219265F
MTEPHLARHSSQDVWLMPVFIAKEGHEGDLQEALRVLQAASRNDPGCLDYTVFSDNQRPGTFVLIERWASREDLTAHNDEPHVKDFVTGAEPLLEVPFSVTPLTPLP